MQLSSKMCQRDTCHWKLFKSRSVSGARMEPFKSLVWLSHRWDRSFSTPFHAVFSLWLPEEDCRSFSNGLCDEVCPCLWKKTETHQVGLWLKVWMCFSVWPQSFGIKYLQWSRWFKSWHFCTCVWTEDGVSWSCVYDSFKDGLSRFHTWISSDVQFCCWCALSLSLTKQHHSTLFTHKGCSTSVGQPASCAGSFTDPLLTSMVVIPLWSCQKVPDTFWCGAAWGAEILCIIRRAGQALERERGFSSCGLLPSTNSSAICCHKKSICLI